MRLAVFTGQYPSRVCTFFERDMRGLLEAGVEIDIFSIYPLDKNLWQYCLGILGPDFLRKNQIHHLSLGQSVQGLKSWPLARLGPMLREATLITCSAMRFGVGPLAKTAYIVPKALTWTGRHGGNYDHVLAYWGNYAATCAYLFHRAINRQVPFSMWLHAGTDLYFRPVYLKQKLLYADNIITCCEFNKSFLSERYSRIFNDIRDRIFVSYHGLDFGRLPYEPNRRASQTVIAVGRFARDKGFDHLLRAAHELKRQGIWIDVQLVGDGEEANELRALCRDLQIEDRVTFTGWLSFDGVQKAMQKATILVHPSDGLGDGLPNVIRESMALGTPVVASRVAGIPEALDGGCGILVPERDPGALAEAIKILLGSEALRLKYAARARARAQATYDLWKNGVSLAARLKATKPRVDRSSY